MENEIEMRIYNPMQLYNLASHTQGILGRLRFKRFECCFENAVFEEILFEGGIRKFPSDYPKGTQRPVLEQGVEDIVVHGPNTKIKLTTRSFIDSESEGFRSAQFRVVSNYSNGHNIVTLSMNYSGIGAVGKYLFGGYTQTACLIGRVMLDQKAIVQPTAKETLDVAEDLRKVFNYK